MSDLVNKENARRVAMGLPKITGSERKPLGEFTKKELEQYLDKVRAASQRLYEAKEDQEAYVNRVKQQYETLIRLDKVENPPKKKRHVKKTDTALVIDDKGEVARVPLVAAQPLGADQPRQETQAPAGDASTFSFREAALKFGDKVFRRAFPTVSNLLDRIERSRADESGNRARALLLASKDLEKTEAVSISLDSLTRKQQRSVDLLEELLVIIKEARRARQGLDVPRLRTLANAGRLASAARTVLPYAAAAGAAAAGAYVLYRTMSPNEETAQRGAEAVQSGAGGPQVQAQREQGALNEELRELVRDGRLTREQASDISRQVLLGELSADQARQQIRSLVDTPATGTQPQTSEQQQQNLETEEQIYNRLLEQQPEAARSDVEVQNNLRAEARRIVEQRSAQSEQVVTREEAQRVGLTDESGRLLSMRPEEAAAQFAPVATSPSLTPATTPPSPPSTLPSQSEEVEGAAPITTTPSQTSGVEIMPQSDIVTGEYGSVEPALLASNVATPMDAQTITRALDTKASLSLPVSNPSVTQITRTPPAATVKNVEATRRRDDAEPADTFAERVLNLKARKIVFKADTFEFENNQPSLTGTTATAGATGAGLTTPVSLPQITSRGLGAADAFMRAATGSVRPSTGQWSTGGGRIGAKEVYDFFIARGWSPAVAAGMVANIDVESSFDPMARGDNGMAHGLAQWTPAGGRRQIVEQFLGMPILQAPAQRQLEAIHWELTQGPERRHAAAIMAARSPAEAAALIDRLYERSDGSARQRRMERAEQAARDFGGAEGQQAVTQQETTGPAATPVQALSPTETAAAVATAGEGSVAPPAQPMATPSLTGMQAAEASVENAIAERTPAAPQAPTAAANADGGQGAAGSLQPPQYLHSVNDPGKVEPDDAAERYARLFNMAA